MKRGLAVLAAALSILVGASSASAGFEEETSIDLIPP